MRSIYSFSNIFSEFKTSIRLALPLMASEIVYALNGFTATIMITHLGKTELAANALVWGVYITVILFFIGVLSATSIMIAQSFGAKDNHGIGVCFKQGLILALILTIPMMIIMWLAPVVLVWTKQDPAVIESAKPFFYALIWTMLPLNIIFLIWQFFCGITKTRVVMLVNIVSVPIQIFFYYTFLFGKFGLPKFGLAGIGYGIVVEHYLVAIGLCVYLSCAKQFKVYKLFNRWWLLNRKFLLELLRVGIPLGFLYCIEVALYAVVAIMMGKLGTTVLAAYQISYQYLMIALVIIFALTQTAQIRVGNEVGRNNLPGIKLAAFVNIGMSVGIMLFFSLFYMLFPHLAISLDFNSYTQTQVSKEVARQAALFLPLVGVLLLSDCLRLISVGSLRGIKDTKFPVISSIIGFWLIAFPMAYLSAFKFNFGGVGIWWGVILGLFTSGVILFVRFNWLIKRVDLESVVTKVGVI